MSEVPKIIEDFLKGNNDAGGTIASLEEKAKQLVAQIEILEDARDIAYNAALEWSASWITGAQLSGHGKEVQEYAYNMAMSIRAAKRGLTSRALDGATSAEFCECGISIDSHTGVYCSFRPASNANRWKA